MRKFDPLIALIVFLDSFIVIGTVYVFAYMIWSS